MMEIVIADVIKRYCFNQDRIVLYK